MKTALREHHLGLTISNSTCSSGRLVIAGYILFKAPNTTHRVRYLQSIRNHLPDNTPFFDILLYRRTPMDDANHHLAVCGESHVSTLTSALSAYLTGKGTAFFLPRIAFAKLTQTQIQKCFDMHKTYIRSLRPIQLSPSIFNLDAPQEEHAPDGTVTQRTTRDPENDKRMGNFLNACRWFSCEMRCDQRISGPTNISRLNSFPTYG